MSSRLKYEVVNSEHVGLSAHGRPERGESAGKTHDPWGRRPPGRRRRVVGFGMRFRSALAGHATLRQYDANKTGRPLVETSRCAIEAALFHEAIKASLFL